VNPPPVSTMVEWEPAACPLCGHEHSRPMIVTSDLLYGFPGQFTLATCDACGHVFMNPRPTRATIGHCYSADYGPFRADVGTSQISHRKSQISNSKSQEARSFRSWTWLRKIVLWWIDSRATVIPAIASGDATNSRSAQDSSRIIDRPRALELGCSHGVFLEQLRQRGWDCVGIEPSAEVAARARAKGFDVRATSLEDAHLSNRDFDTVFAWMVVEHLHDPIGTPRLARELLKPDGWLLFSVPNFGGWERRLFGRFWYGLADVTHLQHFTAKSLRQLLETTGFQLVKIVHQRNVNNLVGSIGLWLRAKLPGWSLGERLLRWTDNPTALGLCVLAPLGRGLAALRQAGRMTVVARHPLQTEESSSNFRDV
jgi:SAM-dependent methyltransferase